MPIIANDKTIPINGDFVDVNNIKVSKVIVIHDGIETVVWEKKVKINVSYVYAGNTYTVEKTPGDLISDYIPDAIANRTFTGWSTSLDNTTPQEIYASNEDMVLYGISNYKNTISKSATAYGRIDNNDNGGSGHAYFTLSGNWPDNATITETVSASMYSYPGTGSCNAYFSFKNLTLGGYLNGTCGNQYGDRYLTRTVNSGTIKSIQYEVYAEAEHNDDEWYGSTVTGTAIVSWNTIEVG